MKSKENLPQASLQSKIAGEVKLRRRHLPGSFDYTNEGRK